MLYAVSTGVLQKSPDYPYSDYSKNYIVYKDLNMSLTNETFWYRRSAETSLSDLTDPTSVNNIIEGSSLLPIFQSVIQDNLVTNTSCRSSSSVDCRGPIKSAYVSYESDGMKVTYPAKYQSFYSDYPSKNDTCEYFPGPDFKMTDYDPRCRAFYISAKNNTPDQTFFGPYSSAGGHPEVAFFAGTISKPVVVDGNLQSIVSIDISLNHKDSFVDAADINQQYSYSFISSIDGRPLYYSRFAIQEVENITFTKLEFANGNTPLNEEPQSVEAQYFNTTILEKIKSATETTQMSYTRFGKKISLTAVPIYIKILWPETGETYIERRGIACIAIDEYEYLNNTNDKRVLWMMILIIMGIFLMIFF